MVTDSASGFLTPSQNYSLSGFTADLKVKAIELLKENMNVGRVCKALGVDRRNFYYALEVDKAFKRAYEDLIEGHMDDAESSMFHRAKQPNGTLAGIFLLKNRRSVIYGERTIVEHQSKPLVTGAWQRLAPIQEAELIPSVAQSPSSPTAELPLDQGMQPSATQGSSGDSATSKQQV